MCARIFACSGQKSPISPITNCKAVQPLKNTYNSLDFRCLISRAPSSPNSLTPISIYSF